MVTMTWRCPFCGHHSVITDELYVESETFLKIDNAEGPRCFKIVCIVCPNPDCKRFTVAVTMHNVVFTGTRPSSVWHIVKEWQLIPRGQAKPVPDYVPEGIRRSYEQAWSVLDVSPDASAALARRCLQGMIRNFWNIEKPTLNQEIEWLRREAKVAGATWKAIDTVRQFGNIASHMDSDAGLVLETSPEEAKKLLWLLETLIEKWYVTRHEEESLLQEIGTMGDLKDGQKKATDKSKK